MNKFGKLFLGGVAMAVLFASSGTAQAAAVIVGGGWHTFGFGGVGTVVGTFDFTVAGPVELKVTDAFLSGDQFYVLGLGLTSLPTSSGDDISADYDSAFADARWSSGSWLLGAGAYSLSLDVILSPFGGGGAALRVDEVRDVPEPASMAMWGLGIVGIAIRRRNKRRQGASAT